MIVLNRVSNSFIASHFSVDVAPPAGFGRATFTGDMANSAVTDTTNYARIDVEADFGEGFHLVKRGEPWHGGPAAVRPATMFVWPVAYPPVAVRGVLVNGTNGYDSGVPMGLDLEFS